MLAVVGVLLITVLVVVITRPLLLQPSDDASGDVSSSDDGGSSRPSKASASKEHSQPAPPASGRLDTPGVLCLDHETGTPLPNVEVRAAGETIARSGADGVVQTLGLPRRPMVFYKFGYIPVGKGPFDESAPRAKRTVRMRSGCVVYVRVINSDGAVVPKVRLLVGDRTDTSLANVSLGIETWLGSVREDGSVPQAVVAETGGDGLLTLGGLEPRPHPVSLLDASLVITAMWREGVPVPVTWPCSMDVSAGASFEVRVERLWYVAAMTQVGCPHRGYHADMGGMSVQSSMPPSLRFPRSPVGHIKNDILERLQSDNSNGYPWVQLLTGPLDGPGSIPCSIGFRFGASLHVVEMEYRMYVRDREVATESVTLFQDCPGHGVVEVTGDENYELDVRRGLGLYYPMTSDDRIHVFDVPAGEYSLMTRQPLNEPSIPVSARKRSDPIRVDVGSSVKVQAWNVSASVRQVVWIGSDQSGAPSDRFRVELRGGHLKLSVQRPLQGTVRCTLPYGKYRVRILDLWGVPMDSYDLSVEQGEEALVMHLNCTR